MKKNVWIFNHYAGDSYFNKGDRHYWFSKFLKKEGYEPVVFVANAKHGVPEQFVETDSLWIEKRAEDIDVPYVFVSSTLYGSNGKDRVKGMFTFYKNLRKAAVQYAKKHGKPDIIYASSAHPLTVVAGIRLAKKFGVKCIGEVRDLWPLAIVQYSERITENSIPARLMYAGEKWIYKHADAMIFTQEGGPDYVCAKGWDKKHGGPILNENLFHINNGVDLEAFDQNRKNFPYADEDLDNPDIFKVLYCGSIRRVANVGQLLDAAKLITNPKIKLLIFGMGDEVDMLKQRIKDEGISNVVIKGYVNKQYIPAIDCKADLNIVHRKMSKTTLQGESYRKSFEYFAAGKPVFYTVRPGYSLAERYHLGRMTEGFEPGDFAAGIQAMAEMSDEERAEMGRNARKAAEDFDFKNLTKKLIEIIESR